MDDGKFKVILFALFAFVVGFAFNCATHRKVFEHDCGPQVDMRGPSSLEDNWCLYERHVCIDEDGFEETCDRKLQCFENSYAARRACNRRRK